MNLGIEGRTAIVCGSSQGLGLACAQALAAETMKSVKDIVGFVRR